jgi:hypothetical protein
MLRGFSFGCAGGAAVTSNLQKPVNNDSRDRHVADFATL